MKLPYALLLISTAAAAAPDTGVPSFEIIDRGEAIEVIAHDVKAARTAVTPTRSRLEIELVGHPRTKPLVPTNGTVKVVELDGAEPRMLSVKLAFERPDVKNLARFAQATQVGDDLHLVFPRTVPAPGVTVVMPEPTLPPAIAAKLAKPAGPPPPPPPAAAEAKPLAADPKPESKEPTPIAGKTEQPFLSTEEPSSRFSIVAALGLVALGGGLWLLKRRKAAQTPSASIDVIAQRSLGSKAKIVWLTAGGREMVVAVTPQHVRMLGQWRKHEGATAMLPHAQALDARAEPRPETQESSSVAGILKLRRKTATYEAVNEDVATGDLDADALWAKEILAATGARR